MERTLRLTELLENGAVGKRDEWTNIHGKERNRTDELVETINEKVRCFNRELNKQIPEYHKRLFRKW